MKTPVLLFAAYLPRSTPTQPNPPHPAEPFYIDLKLLFINYIMNSKANQNLTIFVEFLLNVHVFLIYFLFSDKDLDKWAITTQWMNFLLEFI